MNHLKIIPIITFCFLLLNKTNAQTVLSQNFNDTTFYRTWKVSENIEHAYLLGANQTRYIRFHPKFQNEYIQTPEINIVNTELYALIFDWNEADNNYQDSVLIQLSKNNGITWQSMRTVKNGNTRIWLRDSVFLGTLNAGENISLRWRYYSSKVFPSQYFNLDNIQLKVANTITSVQQYAHSIEVKIFPNPAKSIITLECSNHDSKKLQLKMYAVNGTILRNMILPLSKKNKIEIDVSDISKGTYFMAIESFDEIYTQTIIIQ